MKRLAASTTAGAAAGAILAAFSGATGALAPSQSPPTSAHEAPLRSTAAFSFRATVDPTVLEATSLVGNLNVPWDLVWGPDGALWFTEKVGSVHRWDPSQGTAREIVHLGDTFVSPVENSGLHALGIHPDWPEEPSIFVHHSISNTASQLVRIELEPSTLEESSRSILQRFPAARSHNGSRIVFDHSGHLLLALGDAYRFQPAQNPRDPSGKILRFRSDGRIPPDNPFPGTASWSIGHRNPQGLAWGPDGALFATEHGDRTDDEFNRIEPGANYGWPLVEGFCDPGREAALCREHRIREPLHHWTPTYAPAGLTWYPEQGLIEPLRGSFLITFLKAQRMSAFHLAGDRAERRAVWFSGLFGRLRDVEVDPLGRVYLATSNRERQEQTVCSPEDDRILRIAPGTAWAQLSVDSTGTLTLLAHRALTRATVDVRTETGRPLWSGTLQSLPNSSSVQLPIPWSDGGAHELRLESAGDVQIFRIDLEKRLRTASPAR